MLEWLGCGIGNRARLCEAVWFFDTFCTQGLWYLQAVYIIYITISVFGV